MKALKILVAVLVLLNLFIQNANTELIKRDLQDTNDALITRDTESRLDWLNVSLTVNQNYDDVRTGIWYQAGFRHATKEEIRQLFIHAGTPDDNSNTVVTYPAETLRLINLLGATRVLSATNMYTHGLCGTDFLNNTINPVNHPIGVRFSAQLGKIDYELIEGVQFGEAHFTGGHPFSDERSPTYGSFLVRGYPDQFTFVDKTNVLINTVITSNAITVSGISSERPITIVGGKYSINDGPYADVGGKVISGDKVTVQVTSAATFSTTTNTTLDIDGVSDTFSVTTQATPAGSDGGGGGCFIATAAFGSPLAGQVEILRQFRDRYLLTNDFGKKFVAWYYRNGPIAANYIKDKPMARAAVRVALYPLIGLSFLLNSGYLPFMMFALVLLTLLFFRLRLKKLSDV